MAIKFIFKGKCLQAKITDTKPQNVIRYLNSIKTLQPLSIPFNSFNPNFFAYSIAGINGCLLLICNANFDGATPTIFAKLLLFFAVSEINFSNIFISYLINCSSSFTFCFQLSNTSYSVVCLRSDIACFSASLYISYLFYANIYKNF